MPQMELTTFVPALQAIALGVFASSLLLTELLAPVIFARRSRQAFHAFPKLSSSLTAEIASLPGLFYIKGAPLYPGFTPEKNEYDLAQERAERAEERMEIRLDDLFASLSASRPQMAENSWSAAFSFATTVDYLFTTDHKKIGRLYLIFGFFSALVGSILSLLIRIQLTYPGSVLVGENYQAYNVIITMHAMLMIFMFVMPVLIGGFGNFIVPLHLGIPDVAFPRANALSFWLLPTSLALMYLSMLEKLGPGTG